MKQPTSSQEKLIKELERMLPPDVPLKHNIPLSLYTTLQAGGRARWLVEIHDRDLLASILQFLHQHGVRYLLLGSGSNVLASDHGFNGLVIINACRKIHLEDEEPWAETGCLFQDLFLSAAQRALAGLEFAVGIPGTLGGALVSNAGAYRSAISEFLTEIEVIENGERKWVKPEYLQFDYRNSILRQPHPPLLVLLSARFRLLPGDPKHIYDLARDYQRQRIMKQPPHASAGSFFKNVYSRELAESLPRLPEKLKEAGVVPAGFLIDECGLKGTRIGGALLSPKHANFVCNVGRATAEEIRALAELAKKAVYERFGVTLEEEVLYVGDWSEAA
jgi:UDP-N-acetylmuramate dehydrogenase